MSTSSPSLQKRNYDSIQTNNNMENMSSNKRQRIIVNPYLKKRSTTTRPQPQPQPQPQYQQYRNNTSNTTIKNITNAPLRTSPTFYSPSVTNNNTSQIITKRITTTTPTLNNNNVKSQIKKTSPLQTVDQNTISNTNNNSFLPAHQHQIPQHTKTKVIRNPYANNNRNKANANANSTPITKQHQSNLNININVNTNSTTNSKSQVLGTFPKRENSSLHSHTSNVLTSNKVAAIKPTITPQPLQSKTTTATNNIEKKSSNKKTIESELYQGIDWDSFFSNDGIVSSKSSTTPPNSSSLTTYTIKQKEECSSSCFSSGINSEIVECDALKDDHCNKKSAAIEQKSINHSNSHDASSSNYARILNDPNSITNNACTTKNGISNEKRSNANNKNVEESSSVLCMQNHSITTSSNSNVKKNQMDISSMHNANNSITINKNTKLNDDILSKLPPKDQTGEINGSSGNETTELQNNKSNSYDQQKSSLSESITCNVDASKSNTTTLLDSSSTTTKIQKENSNIKIDSFFQSDGTTKNSEKSESNKIESSATRSSSISSNKAPSQPLPPELSYSPGQVKPINDRYTKALMHNAKLNSKLNNDWTLMPHQKDAVTTALNMRRLLLAFDMGLGKTLIGCVWAKAFKRTIPKLKVFVICPVSLKESWAKEAYATCGLETCKQSKKDGSCNCNNSNNDTEDKKKKKKSNNNDEQQQQDCWNMCIASWAKIPVVKKCVRKYVVIFDEAHQMQSMEAARTKNALKIINSQYCVGCLLLTGTPMKNGKPLNLFPLLKAVKHPFGSHQKAFEKFFCAAKEKYFSRGKKVWDASGSSNLDILNRHIASHVLYLTKEDCLKDLPKQTREYRNITVSSYSELKYSTAMNELCKIYDAFQASKLNSESTMQSEAILGAIQRIRVVCSLAKADATVSISKEILNEHPAVVIFTSFVSVAQKIYEALTSSGFTGELFTGQTPQSKRQGMVDNFQDGLSAFFVCTFGAGGVGLTLTASSHVILVDRPWTPGDAFQAEDRVRRIGQTKPVKSIWIKAFFVDEQIDNMINQKNQNALCVVTQKKESDDNDGDNEDNNISKPPPKVSILQLMKSLIPKNHINKLHGLQQQNHQGQQAKNDFAGSPNGDNLAGGLERT